MSIVGRTLLLFLMSLNHQSCKPSGRALEPIVNSRKQDPGQQPGLDTRVDPASIVAKLSSVPEGESRITNLQIGVSGDGLTHYTFKIGPSITTECGLAYDYILQSIDLPIQLNIDHLPDGDIQICVVGQHISGLWQPYERASAAGWNKQTGALSSPINLTAVPAQERISLVWERPDAVEGFLIVRSRLPIEWLPTMGESYEPGPIDNLEVLLSDRVTSLIDTGLTNNLSYYYAVFSYDVQYRYSPPALIAAIPSPEAYTWVRLEPGAFLRGAVVGGTRFDNSRSLYICRAVHIDPNGANFGQHTGKFVPVAPGDLTAGACYYPFGDSTFRITANFELLVMTRGRFEDWLQWTPMTVGNFLPTTAYVAGVAEGPMNIYICRFVVGDNGYYKPGKIAVGMDGCHVDVFARPSNLRSEPSYQLLTIKSL